MGRDVRLRKGYTTGSCAAAAAKVATGLLYGTLGTVNGSFYSKSNIRVDIPLPRGGTLQLLVELINEHEPGIRYSDNAITCQVIKDGGDDPDATHGLEIRVTAVPLPSEIEIYGGIGVGTVTKPGLAVEVGEPAINPVPRSMILSAVSEVLPAGAGVRLTVWVPGGEVVGKSTLNPRLGIVDGISILGTTGIVEPMSEEAFKHSLDPQIDVALAAGHRILALTPGHMGQRGLERQGTPLEAVVLTSNFIGYMLDSCHKKGVEEVLLWGHIGKLVKLAGGIFHTHSKVADGRREIIAAHAAARGYPVALVQSILTANTAQEAVAMLTKAGHYELFDHLAELAAQKSRERFQGNVSVVFTDLKGEPLGWSQHAKAAGKVWGWDIL